MAPHKPSNGSDEEHTAEVAHEHKMLNAEQLLLIKEHCLPDGPDVESSPSFILNPKDRMLSTELRKNGHWDKGELSFVAPGAIGRLFSGRDLVTGKPTINSNLTLKMGQFSNVQEVRRFHNDLPSQPVEIQIGDRSSIAHGVRFKVTKNKKPGEFLGIVIGNDVFVGINSTLSDEVTVGDGTAIGFNAVLEDGVKIGRNVIIGDGAHLGEGVVIPDNCIVLADAVVTRDNMNQISSITRLDDYLSYSKRPDEPKGSGIFRATREQLGSVGNVYAFLADFNDIVVEDNMTFPIMKKLLYVYHPECVHVADEAKNITFVSFPVDKQAFLSHYLREAEASQHGKGYQVQKYHGEFTKTEVGHEVDAEQNLYISGEAHIQKTHIGKHVVMRGDENGSFFVEGSWIGDGTVFHAANPKHVKRSAIGKYNVVHGAVDFDGVHTFDDNVFHNVSAKNTHVAQRTSLVEVDVEDSEIGSGVTITGHRPKDKQAEIGRVRLRHASLSNNIYMRYGVVVEGGKKHPVHIGKNTYIGHMNTIEKVERIGENVSMRSNIVLKNCGTVGDYAVIESNCQLENISNIPERTIVQKDTVCVGQADWEKAIQEGKVILDARVPN